MGLNDKLEDIVRGSLYTEIRVLSDGKSIVMDPETETLYYKKRLSVYSIPVFRYLKENKHKNIPEIHLFWQEEGDLIVIEELIQGKTLDEMLESGEKIPFEEKKRILLELCDALEYLHSSKPPIIHRDIKAANVMIRSDNTVKLIDYDAAKQFVAEKTRDTVLIGTQGIAAPEQYGFGQSDERTDIYAMGKLIEHLLPESVHAMEIAEKATRLQPDMRYGTISEMRRQIDHLWDPVISDAEHRKQVIRTSLRSRTAKRVFICAGLLVVIVTGWILFRKLVYPEFFVRRPAYNEGIALMEEGKYEEAAGQFEICGKDYKDTAEQMKTCEEKLSEIRAEEEKDRIRDEYISTATTAMEKWRSSKVQQTELNALEACIKLCIKGLDSGETLKAFCGELLQEALQNYEKGLEVRSRDTMLQMEKKLRVGGVYQEIMEEKRKEYFAALEENDDYKIIAVYYEKLSEIDRMDHKDEINENNYLYAMVLKKNGSYKAAAELFLKMFEYKDSAERKKECDYLAGKEYISQGKWKDAVLYLNKADDYPGAADLANQAKYSYCQEHADAPDDQTRIYLEELKKAGYSGSADLKNQVEEWKVTFELKEVSAYEVTVDLTFTGGPADGMDGYKAVLHTKDGTTSTYIDKSQIVSGSKENIRLMNTSGGTLKSVKRLDIYTAKGKLIGSYSR